MKTLFILNPRAGKPRDEGLLEETISSIAGSMGRSFEILSSSSVAETDQYIDYARRESFELVCAVGGDGSVHEIGKRLIGSGIALAILPTGSGNGIARHLGIPCDPAAALETFRQARIERIDTGLVNGDPFLGIFGIGFDATVAHRFAEAGRRGLATYVQEGALAWWSYTRETYRLEIGDETEEHEALLIAVANSGQYGNEARVAPLASLQDGTLDIAILHDASIFGAPLLLWRLFTGRFNQANAVSIRRARRGRIIRSNAGPAHVDGEPRDLPAEIKFEVRESSLDVLVPAGVRNF